MQTPVSNIIDILEDKILSDFPQLLEMLLVDRTTSHNRDNLHNIIWATDDYQDRGMGFSFFDEITPERITGDNGMVIQPRVCKSRQVQAARSRNKAEVFTPSWICNAQNNLIDAAWFGCEDVFNRENDNHTWTRNPDQIIFPQGMTWQDYVGELRLEITCGEAPYLASRYDTVTGEFIAIPDRIGLLDRKLRVVSENCPTPEEWLPWAKKAYQSIYGYEWQGDNLLIARETLLYTFIEYYFAKFGQYPSRNDILNIAEIISWNLWQMDGLNFVTPGQKASGGMNSLLGDNIYCIIRDWSAPEDKQIVTFYSLVHHQ